ncbi:MAG: bifunctional glutamate N-acetyltransferase/amino-acid acetyltransferase ArgJ [Alphaproteobacteria bacterium]|jgi:glutamate N-acetyltransferase / amino-acid N-acetyltransferase|nr:bifunctional glutamate N-acetyltransferase/amino-acid acetyltransferase ArgJ [Alphaproteobacteria bacterium]
MTGVTFSACSAGIKNNGAKDLMLAILPKNTTYAAAFSTSYIVSPTLDWDKAVLLKKTLPRALIVNSGNANSFTGKHGKEAILNITKAVAEEFAIKQDEVLISSTGVIGEKLPYKKIINKLDYLKENLSEANLSLASEAILTTDSAAKTAEITSEIAGTKVKIEAIAKGAGMAAPNMATVLAYFFTDAKIENDILQKIFSENIEKTFNAFTIDGDMSTNDTAMIFATGKAENKKVNLEELTQFKQDLLSLMAQICNEIVAKGEGVTKTAKIHVKGAKSVSAAKNVAMSIANSPLVKTALNGEDPNWGRIVMAVGKAKEELDLEKFCLNIGGTNIVLNGELNPVYDEATSTSLYMKESLVNIYVDLGLAERENQFIATTSDLSKGYIEINADYRS